MLKTTLALTLTLITLTVNAMSFGTAKHKLNDIYKNAPYTFYCNCEISWDLDTNKPSPLPQKCGYIARNPVTSSGKHNKRSTRVEWEHKISAEEFGRQLGCWVPYVDENGKRRSARYNCQRNSDIFKNMDGDLFNLEPAVGEINGDRSNFRYSMIEGEERVYGACDAEVDFKQRVFEPMPTIRGDIARTYLYFILEYGMKVSKKQKQLYDAWNKLDPVSPQECKIHALKAKEMKKENPFVAERCD